MNKSIRYILLLIGILLSLVADAQVRFSFSDGIKSGALKDRMESNVTNLLTEITRAGMSGSSLNLSGIEMEENAKSRLTALWNDVVFVCNNTKNRSKCLEDYQGYQIREIPISMKSVSVPAEPESDRELTISLNKNGVITGVRPAWETQESINSIMKSSSSVKDTRERYEILKWVEDFRCYYNEKNINALNQIYSDDALIITGSVVKQQRNSGDFNSALESNIKYKKQSKEEYINRLATIFKGNKKINVEFCDIEVMRHGARPNIYGVRLRQKWQSGAYKDEGILFLLWDFNNPDYPQIYVRTWQPDVVSEDEMFNIYDFSYDN